MAKPRRPRRTFTCPNCGAEVPEGAAACPECGADDETGWAEDAEYADILPDPEEDAEVTYESAERTPSRKSWWFILVIAALLLIVLLWQL